MLDALVWLLFGSGLVPLDIPTDPVYPVQGNGFAAYIVGGFFGLGVLILFMIWISKKPKRRR